LKTSRFEITQKFYLVFKSCSAPIPSFTLHTLGNGKDYQNARKRIAETSLLEIKKGHFGLVQGENSIFGSDVGRDLWSRRIDLAGILAGWPKTIVIMIEGMARGAEARKRGTDTAFETKTIAPCLFCTFL